MEGNYNEEITIKVLSKEDLYVGRYVQSFGNTTFVYQIIEFNSDKIRLLSAYRMWNGVLVKDTYRTTQWVKGHTKFCDTIRTHDKNIDTNRDWKLELMGIK